MNKDIKSEMKARIRMQFRKLEEAGKPVPPHNHQGLINYIVDHIAPGSFLTNVLCNDLKAACVSADWPNAYNMWNVVNFLYNHAPIQCWGDREKFNKWIADGNND